MPLKRLGINPLPTQKSPSKPAPFMALFALYSRLFSCSLAPSLCFSLEHADGIRNFRGLQARTHTYSRNATQIIKVQTGPRERSGNEKGSQLHFRKTIEIESGKVPTRRLRRVSLRSLK